MVFVIFVSYVLKKIPPLLSIPINSLWEAIELNARSPDKFMDVTSAKVSDEDCFLFCSIGDQSKEHHHKGVYHRSKSRCDSGDATPRTDRQDSSTDSGESTSAVP